MSIAYGNRISNFNKTVENATELKAEKQHKVEIKDSPKPESSSPSKMMNATGPPKVNTQRNTAATRSPIVSKSIDHVFGAKNLPSDEIGKVVSNEWMREAAVL